MRTAYKVWIGVAAATFCLVAVTDLTGPHPSAASSTAPAPAAPVVPAAPPAPVAPAAAVPAAVEPAAVEPAVPATELVTVTGVVDGDTLTVSGNRTVELLDLDACPVSTKGGREAKENLAVYAAPGQEVELVADGTRDTDSRGRLLRRAQRPTTYPSPDMPYLNDIGTSVVSDAAVGVLPAAENDASPEYRDELEDHDYGTRDCSGTPEVPTSTGGDSYSYDSDDHHHVNLPDGALTGGYCAKKWWC
ncbi:thermonuclease family protein [Pseudonocardia phyllosphaerae]|uniref:thermonuclease family protein n=1 Tax=Pseudonocardia phyllosphaerae TaxID=3390502 RepID=UPI00397AE567